MAQQGGGAQPQAGAEGSIGDREFVRNCAVCHGREGRGNGPLVDQLSNPPPSLTTLAKDNNGQFPFERVFAIIDGREMVPGHGTQEMPIWGDRYTARAFDQFGPYGTEQFVRGRILELVFYIQSIQEQ